MLSVVTRETEGSSAWAASWLVKCLSVLPLIYFYVESSLVSDQYVTKCQEFFGKGAKIFETSKI